MELITTGAWESVVSRMLAPEANIPIDGSTSLSVLRKLKKIVHVSRKRNGV